jgi:hypothetical protein
VTLPSFARDRLRRSPAAWLPALAICAVTAWVFAVFNDNFLHRDFAYDESYFVWGGWCINKGLVPYRDFLEFKPPLLFLTHALALKLYGYAAFQYRWFFLWFPMVSVLALQAALISRGADKLATLALGLAIVELWVNPKLHDTALSDSESVGLAYYYLGVACLLARTRFGDRLKAPGAALLLACALSKEPFLVSSATTGVCCFLADANPSTLRRDALRFGKLAGLGIGVLIAALCLWMIPTGAMTAYVGTFMKYVRLYRDPARSYCVALGRVHPTTPMHDLLLQGRQALVDYINLTTLGYLIPFALVWIVFTARRSLLLLAGTVVTMALAFYSVTASNCQWMHYYLLSQNGMFFAFVMGLDSMTGQLRHRLARRFVGAGLLVSAVVACWPRYEVERQYMGTRSFHNPYRELVTGSLEVVAKNTTPADRVFTTGPPLLYPQSDRIGATRESNFVDEDLAFYDGDNDVERLSGIRAQLEQNMPKVFMTDPENAPRKVRHRRALIDPFLTAHKYVEVRPNVWLRPY